MGVMDFFKALGIRTGTHKPSTGPKQPLPDPTWTGDPNAPVIVEPGAAKDTGEYGATAPKQP